MMAIKTTLMHVATPVNRRVAVTAFGARTCNRAIPDMKHVTTETAPKPTHVYAVVARRPVAIILCVKASKTAMMETKTTTMLAPTCARLLAAATTSIDRTFNPDKTVMKHAMMATTTLTTAVFLSLIHI